MSATMAPRMTLAQPDEGSVEPELSDLNGGSPTEIKEVKT